MANNKRLIDCAQITDPSPLDLMLVSDVSAGPESKKITLQGLTDYIANTSEIMTGMFNGTSSLSTTASLALRSLNSDHATVADSATTATSVFSYLPTTDTLQRMVTFVAGDGALLSPGGITVANGYIIADTFYGVATEARLAYTASLALTSSYTLTAATNYANFSGQATNATNAVNAQTASLATTALKVSPSIGNSVLPAYLLMEDIGGDGTIKKNVLVTVNNGTLGATRFAGPADSALYSTTANEAYYIAPNAAFSKTPYNLTASIASRALIADLAITTNNIIVSNLSSASFASRSLSSSISDVSVLANTASYIAATRKFDSNTYNLTASNSITSSYVVNSATASYLIPSIGNRTYGIFSALTQSLSGSQLDVVNMTSNIPITASIDVMGTVIVPISASSTVSESITLNALNRSTGKNTVLDMMPVYVKIVDLISSGSIKIPYTLMGEFGSNWITNAGIYNDDYMLYVSATTYTSSIKLDSIRSTKYGININAGNFTVSSGEALIPRTTYNTNNVYAADYEPYTDGNGPAITYYSGPLYGISISPAFLDVSTITGSVYYTWKFTRLTTISSSNNLYLTDIDGMPDSLVTMSITNGTLTGLRPLNTTVLEFFDLHNNSLQSLPALPSTVKYLNCASNSISTLPTSLPASLTYFNCSNNRRISSLPASFPSGLKELYCDTSSILSAPATFPNSILTMSFSNNVSMSAFTTTLPTGLKSFRCNYNPLLTGSFATIPVNVISMSVNGNNLTDGAQYDIADRLYTNGLLNGYLNVNGNQSRTSPTNTKLAGLQTDKGWTVVI